MQDLLNQLFTEYETAVIALSKMENNIIDKYSEYSDDYSVYKAGQKTCPEKDRVDFLFNRICMLKQRPAAMEIHNKYMVK